MPASPPAARLQRPSAERFVPMPRKSTIDKSRKDARQGKAPTTQAGEFVHEEIEHVREGKHGARSARQAIAIGLSKARRAGVKLPPPRPGATSTSTRRKAEQDEAVGQSGRRRPPSPKRASASKRALKREGHAAASTQALSQQAKRAATARRKRGKRAKAPDSKATAAGRRSAASKG
jgi:hypothetical protein